MSDGRLLSPGIRGLVDGPLGLPRRGANLVMIRGRQEGQSPPAQGLCLRGLGGSCPHLGLALTSWGRPLGPACVQPAHLPRFSVLAQMLASLLLALPGVPSPALAPLTEGSPREPPSRKLGLAPHPTQGRGGWGCWQTPAQAEGTCVLSLGRAPRALGLQAADVLQLGGFVQSPVSGARLQPVLLSLLPALLPSPSLCQT